MYLTPAFFGKHPSTRVKVRPHDGCDWPTFAARPLTNDVRFCPCLPKSVTSSVLALPRFCPYLEPGLTRQNCRRSTTIPPSFIVSLISSQSFSFLFLSRFFLALFLSFSSSQMAPAPRVRLQDCLAAGTSCGFPIVAVRSECRKIR